MSTVFIVLLVIASLVIIVTTTLMEPKQRGSGSVYGQESSAFGKTAHQTREEQLQKVSIIAAVVFMISLIGILATY